MGPSDGKELALAVIKTIQATFFDKVGDFAEGPPQSHTPPRPADRTVQRATTGTALEIHPLKMPLAIKRSLLIVIGTIK